ncbi:MAG: 3-deoxy-7-phosphoheptulonate synthase, partial [Thermomicrobiales bacterium]
MIIVMKTGAGRELIDPVVARVEELGLHAHLIDGEERTIIGVVGLPLPPTLDEMFSVYEGVEQVV